MMHKLYNRGGFYFYIGHSLLLKVKKIHERSSGKRKNTLFLDKNFITTPYNLETDSHKKTQPPITLLTTGVGKEPSTKRKLDGHVVIRDVPTYFSC